MTLNGLLSTGMAIGPTMKATLGTAPTTVTAPETAGEMAMAARTGWGGAAAAAAAAEEGG